VLIIYGDVHLGVQRTANTTPASRLKLQQCIQSTLESILDMPGEKIGLGDLFDTANNPEHVIQYGSSVVDRTTLTLAGNHDLISDSTKLSSLQLVSEFHPRRIALTPFGEAGIHVQTIGGAHTVSIPHATTQDLFIESLEMAVQHVTTTTASVGMPRILLFHANFDSPYELTETSINMTPEWAERLLNSGYEYVIGGHEHNGRDLYDGRLVMLGNVFCTGFSDISDKRIAILDEEGIRFERVWSMEGGYEEWDVNEDPPLTCTQAQFVRVKGNVPSEGIGKVSKAVSTLWKTGPNLLALRSEVRVTDTQQQDTSGIEVTAETLPALVESELASDPAMKALWQEFTAC
jgi:DNA repair exonuclease SbcCD nuclease subunit